MYKIHSSYSFSANPLISSPTLTATPFHTFAFLKFKFWLGVSHIFDITDVISVATGMGPSIHCRLVLLPVCKQLKIRTSFFAGSFSCKQFCNELLDFVDTFSIRG